MEVSVKKFEHVVNAVVRLHNFCRERKADVPSGDVGTTLPMEITFDSNNVITSDYFETVPVRTGRPAKDQAAASTPREGIRRALEVQGFSRPEHNIARNRNRA